MDRILSTLRPSSLSPMLSFKTSMCSSHLGKSKYKERHGNRVDIAVLRIFVAGCFVRTGAWKKGDFKLTTKFGGQSVGIVGLCWIGLAIAKRAEAFGCPISYCSRAEKQYPNYKYHSTIFDFASNCQILILACNLSDETCHIV